MKLTPDVLEINLSDVEDRIKRFIKGYVEINGFDGVVIGLSGGVDSSTIMRCYWKRKSNRIKSTRRGNV